MEVTEIQRHWLRQRKDLCEDTGCIARWVGRCHQVSGIHQTGDKPIRPSSFLISALLRASIFIFFFLFLLISLKVGNPGSGPWFKDIIQGQETSKLPALPVFCFCSHNQEMLPSLQTSGSYSRLDCRKGEGHWGVSLLFRECPGEQSWTLPYLQRAYKPSGNINIGQLIT